MQAHRGFESHPIRQRRWQAALLVFKRERPVFLLGLHRSRSTLLQRVLNAHPKLVVWGEHGGLINKLAELNATSELVWNVERPISERGLRRFATKAPELLNGFEPWATPWDPKEYRNSCRRFLTRTFRRDLRPGQRWGIKEIRYASPDTTRFLASLYPESQFIVLRRDLLGLCVSSILCTWSLDVLGEMRAGDTVESATNVIMDCCYAAAALDWQLDRSIALLGQHAFVLQDYELNRRWKEIFAFLDLRLDGAICNDVRTALSHVTGSTATDGGVGLIDRAFILDQAPRHLAQAAVELAKAGPDLARLRGMSGAGRYCFLLGDHAFRHTRFSSMFW